MSKRSSLGFSAIAIYAVLNILQVGIGLTQFTPFREAAEANEALSGLAFSIFALAFFAYNAAKILLGLAAIVFGLAKLKDGGKVLGGATVLIGAAAFIANTLVMMFGLEGFLPPPVAGGTGVAATVLLGICLLGFNRDD